MFQTCSGRGAAGDEAEEGGREPRAMGRHACKWRHQEEAEASPLETGNPAREGRWHTQEGESGARKREGDEGRKEEVIYVCGRKIGRNQEGNAGAADRR